MFIKISAKNNIKYASLVSSYREDGKVKHRQLLNLGRLELVENNDSLYRLGLKLIELATRKKAAMLSKDSYANILNYGYFAYKKLWDGFGLPDILNKKEVAGNIDFSLNDSVFFMGITHLLNPSSKLYAYNRQKRYYDLNEVKLHNIYRSLDILAKNKERIEEYLFNKKADLFNLSLDVVFYDVTTFYFESVKKDSLKDFGYSKDNKLNEVQVVLGLLIDKDSVPIGYELFPGNTYEGKTLEVSLEKLKKRFNIDRVIVVADKGMNSKINLQKIKDMGFDYIISSRLKNFKEDMLKKVFSKEGYVKEKTYSYKKIEYDGISLIAAYSEERALLDREKRKKLIEKAKELLKNPSSVTASNKRGGKKYIKEQRCSFNLDTQAIEKDERFDGYYVIQTSKPDLTPKEIISSYHNLYRIEESFRIMKSTMEVRPIFHWTESRIKGHFVVCFLSFLLERTLEFKLKDKKIDYSPEAIKEALNLMNYSEINIGEEKILIKSNPVKLANQIFSTLHIRPFTNKLPVKLIAQS